jgi:hypothetical protein
MEGRRWKNNKLLITPGREMRSTHALSSPLFPLTLTGAFLLASHPPPTGSEAALLSSAVE